MRRSLHEEALAALDLALAASGAERQMLLEHALVMHQVALEADGAAGHANNNEPDDGQRRRA
jgi:hypothetical protein